MSFSFSVSLIEWTSFNFYKITYFLLISRNDYLFFDFDSNDTVLFNLYHPYSTHYKVLIHSYGNCVIHWYWMNIESYKWNVYAKRVFTFDSKHTHKKYPIHTISFERKQLKRNESGNLMENYKIRKIQY